MATKSCLHRCPHTSVSVYLLPLHSWQEKGRSLSLKVSFKKFWLGQELSDLFVQCEFEHGLFFIVLLQLLWLETYSSVWFLPADATDLGRQRHSSSWCLPSGVAFAAEEKPVVCSDVDIGSVFCSMTLGAAAGPCIKLLMCCAVEHCLDLISNLWLFLKACSRDCIPTHTAPMTLSISWVSKYRTEKIH